MAEGDRTRLEGCYPEVYSFITCRRENHGALIFNPYLYAEKWIDPKCCDVLMLSDGTKSVHDIVKSVSDGWRLDAGEAEGVVLDRLRELQGYFAIRLRESPDHAAKMPMIEGGSVRGGDYYSAPTSVLWYLTYRCNMSCRHCLVGDIPPVEEMGLGEAERVLRELRRAGIFSVNFSGGEPLLRNDLLDILKIASDLHLGTTLSTNGLLLNERLVDRLKELDVFCYQVSVDGIGAVHDNLRGARGAYEKAIGSLKLLASKGLYTTMSTMVTMENAHQLAGLLDLAASIGVSSFKLNAFMPVGRGRPNRSGLEVPPEVMRDIAEGMEARRRLYEGRINVQLDALCPWLLEPEPDHAPATTWDGDSERLRCSAGHTTLVISPDGALYPCPYLTDFRLGNILKDSLSAIWNDNSGILGRLRGVRQVDLKGRCRSCRYVPGSCTGGCRAAAYIQSGDLYGEDPFCWK